jgi:LPS-assembly protein
MRFRTWFSCWFVFVLLPTVAAVAVQSSDEKQVDISADQVEYDQNTKMAIARGHVVIVKEDVRLTANQARYNQSNKDMFAEGNVRFTKGSQEWVCESLYYNFETKALSVDLSRGKIGFWYDQAETTRNVGTNRYDATNGYLTTCDYAEPHWRIAYKRLEIYPDDKIVGHDAVMYAGSVPVFWWPYFQKSVGDRGVPLSGSAGVDSRFGPFLYLAYRWDLTENFTLTPHLDLRTKHGIGLGADAEYKAGAWGKGLLRGYWVSDEDPREKEDTLYNKPPDLPVYKEDFDSNRYRLQWEHKTALPADTEFMVLANKLSDPDIIEDYFRSEYRNDIQPDSFASLTRTGEQYTAGVLARPNLNEFFTETERLPEAQFSMVRTPLWRSGLYYQSDNSFTELHRDYSDDFLTALPPPKDFNTLRGDTFHQLSYPKLLFGWLSVVPRVGGRATWYGATDTADHDSTLRGVFGTGTELSFKLSHVYDCSNDRLEIHGLRHVVTPSVNYSYVWRSRNDPPKQLYQFDTIDAFDPLADASPKVKQYNRPSQTTRFNPVDFPAFNAIDAIDNEDVFRTGIRNQLQTKRDGRPYDLLDLYVFSDLHINPRKEQDTDLFTFLELRPTQWSALDIQTRYNFDDSDLVDLNTEMRVLRQDKWSVGFGTRYLRDDSNQGSLDLHYTLNENWAVRIVERMNFENAQLDEQEYTIYRDLHCWTAAFTFRYLHQEVGSDDLQFLLVFSLKALPQVRPHGGS